MLKDLLVLIFDQVLTFIVIIIVIIIITTIIFWIMSSPLDSSFCFAILELCKPKNSKKMDKSQLNMKKIRA